MNIENRIKQIRESKRIKQIEIADALNMDNSQYAKLEKRGKKLSLEQIELIANALGVSVTELIGVDISNTNINSDEMKRLLKENEELKLRITDLEDDKRRLKKELDDYEYSNANPTILLAYNIAMQEIENVMEFLSKKYMLNQENSSNSSDLSSDIFRKFRRSFNEAREIEISNVLDGDETRFTIKSSIFNTIVENTKRLKAIIGEINITLFRKEYYDFLVKYQANLKENENRF
ncbi:helix-turn-helix protein [Arcicella aurantiaca]|uniref:Helix-turn-helix protein n=1 Tax=Arcicella aurantiaca TaxID=591202 RepID=A0A316EGX2_9BACT|nr:helix-turn-helix transcriptional regulator [Arcicella aurantiaca]PWK28958.1 helix-turn-helix protein [Arcicella aurantiaca]